ncbi:MAG: (d)CMP kinase [Paracoccaceae bacterium]
MKFIVAIDGTAGSGKGTIGREISRHFNFRYLDTGLLYRALAFNLRNESSDLSLISEMKILEAINSIDLNLLDPKELRKNEFGEKASLIAKNSFAREKLLKQQRIFANQTGGTILDGRDIGTIVCPNANVKIFIDADKSVRAKRRMEQFIEQNIKISYSEVLANLNNRDERDRSRKIAPMIAAQDALLIDTTNMTIKQSLDVVFSKINAELKKITLNS